MKYIKFVVTCVTMAATAYASPLSRQGSDTPNSRSHNGGTINAPLMDWIKNGNTDLQWYTTISVGTPPQDLYVLPFIFLQDPKNHH